MSKSESFLGKSSQWLPRVQVYSVFQSTALENCFAMKFPGNIQVEGWPWEHLWRVGPQCLIEEIVQTNRWVSAEKQAMTCWGAAGMSAQTQSEIQQAAIPRKWLLGSWKRRKWRTWRPLPHAKCSYDKASTSCFPCLCEWNKKEKYGALLKLLCWDFPPTIFFPCTQVVHTLLTKCDQCFCNASTFS